MSMMEGGIDKKKRLQSKIRQSIQHRGQYKVHSTFISDVLTQNLSPPKIDRLNHKLPGETDSLCSNVTFASNVTLAIAGLAIASVTAP